MMIVLAACATEGNKTVDREKIKQEMKDRQIKRVSEPELMDAAFQTGSALVNTAEHIVIKKLDDYHDTIPTDNRNSSKWIINPPLSQVVIPVLDSLSRRSGHFLSLFSTGLEGLKADTLDIEKQLLEAYRYNMENNLPSEDNVQRSGTDYLLFTRPITSKNRICLLARPEKKIGILPDSLQGQPDYFCGMWSIRLSKKEIIKSL